MKQQEVDACCCMLVGHVNGVDMWHVLWSTSGCGHWVHLLPITVPAYELQNRLPILLWWFV
jgi:hypothetical protein